MTGQRKEELKNKKKDSLFQQTALFCYTIDIGQ